MIARLQHAGERVDLVDHDGHCANARLDAIRDRAGLDADQARRKERLTGFHRQLQFRAGHGVEAGRRDRTPWRELARHRSRGHGLGPNQIATTQVASGHHHLDHLALWRKARFFKRQPIADVVARPHHRDAAEGQGTQRHGERAPGFDPAPESAEGFNRRTSHGLGFAGWMKLVGLRAAIRVVLRVVLMVVISPR